MNYYCCTDARRNAIRQHPLLNGIDYLEVLDDLSDPFDERQTTLFIRFLKPVQDGMITPDNLVIEGGERIRNIMVLEATPVSEDFLPVDGADPEGYEVWMVKVSRAGDFSSYTLRLRGTGQATAPPDGFDPVMSSVTFSFKAACKTEFDCKPAHQCVKPAQQTPVINYLTKDYAGFRQLMLDRISLLVPGWKERNAADTGIALVELLAYTADYLSYRQDAIATEAYLDTARKRISVRRHARLVDYFIHDGCNARTWLHLQVGDHVAGIKLEKGSGNTATKVLTRQDGLPVVAGFNTKEYEKALEKEPVVFELMHDTELYASHNEMHFYTWGERACCLPKGATSATLTGDLSTLRPGDVLIFCEVLGPDTGVPQDANPKQRHAVRLTGVHLSHDPLLEGLGSPPDLTTFPLTEITWHADDALPVPFCISTQKGLENVSVALGNNVLIDHGITMEDTGGESSLTPFEVPPSTVPYAGSGPECSCNSTDADVPEMVAARYYPRLKKSPLTQAANTDFANLSVSATSLINLEMRQISPAITLHEIPPLVPDAIRPDWKPQRDLLNSGANAKEFVVEIESDGSCFIRFGDGKQGERPVAGTTFTATCRVGNGVAGNIGAGTLVHLVTQQPEIKAAFPEGTRVWNPLAATGGKEPETMEEVKQMAPNAFRKQERAVIPEDYDYFSRKHQKDIQRTAATIRWTGSWRTVFLTADRMDGKVVDEAFETALRNSMERYRMAGFDLEVDAPLFVSLELEMKVCVHKDFFVSDVKAALLEVFSNRLLPDGSLGMFHPDRFSFGETVYLSPLYAAAQAVKGVESVKITRFAKQGTQNNDAVANGKFLLARREIARLDNDPDFPEHGVLKLIMNGGR